jgi:hypothetical protein
MAEPFIFINTYKFKPGKEEEYRAAFQEVADIVDAQEPKMLYFAEHVTEDGSQATTVQVHSDPDNMAHHMRLVDKHIREASEYLDWSSMSIQIFGSPSEAVLEQMRELAGAGVSVTVSPAEITVNRLPVPEEQTS